VNPNIGSKRLSRQRPIHSAIERGGSKARQLAPDFALLARSALHREYLVEQDEILRLKWLESEKAGRDIGLEYARAIWVANHRTLWRKARQASLLSN
jgi:hypothetical protein